MQAEDAKKEDLSQQKPELPISTAPGTKSKRKSAWNKIYDFLVGDDIAKLEQTKKR